MNSELKRCGINEVAFQLGKNPQTLRKYENDFNIKIPRDSHNSRYYTDKEVELFEQIIKLKDEGLSTRAIKKMLDKSCTYQEHRDNMLDVVSVDTMNGQDLSLIFKKQINESILEFEERIQQQFDTLKNSYDVKLEQQKKEFEFMLSGLRHNISKDIQNTFEQQSKKGFFSRMFNR